MRCPETRPTEGPGHEGNASPIAIDQPQYEQPQVRAKETARTPGADTPKVTKAKGTGGRIRRYPAAPGLCQQHSRAMKTAPWTTRHGWPRPPSERPTNERVQPQGVRNTRKQQRGPL
ncbi:hypothetical protein V6N13_148622 [Hibiscus sabdariffa]